MNSSSSNILRLKVKKNQDDVLQRLIVKSGESLNQAVNPLIKELQTLGVDISSWSRTKIERIDENDRMLSDKLMNFLQSSTSDWMDQVIVKVINQPEYFKRLELLFKSSNFTLSLLDILLGILVGMLTTLISFILWNSRSIEKINQRKSSYRK